MDASRLADLVRRAQEGEKEAREAIFSLYLERLHRRMSGKLDPLLRPKLDTSELVQTGLREALEDLPDFEDRGPGSFYRWLCRIVEHKLYRKSAFWRAARRDVRREVRVEASDPPSPQRRTETDPAEAAERAESLRSLRDAIGALEEPARTVLLLHQDGLSERRIAAETGMSLDAVRWARAKAFREVAKRLGRREDAGS